MQIDMFAAPPTEMRFTAGKTCHAEVEIVRLDDDSFGYRTSYHFSGFCGGVSPVWPQARGWPSERDAAAVALDKLADTFNAVIRDQSSVCTSSHKAAACRALVWLDQQYAAHGLDPLHPRHS